MEELTKDLAEELALRLSASEVWLVAAVAPEDEEEPGYATVELLAVCDAEPKRSTLRRVVAEMEAMLSGTLNVNCCTPADFAAQQQVMGRKAWLAVNRGRRLHP